MLLAAWPLRDPANSGTEPDQQFPLVESDIDTAGRLDLLYIDSRVAGCLTDYESASSKTGPRIYPKRQIMNLDVYSMSQPNNDHHLRGYRSTSSMHSMAAQDAGTRQIPLSLPVPQTEWTRIPDVFHPRHQPAPAPAPTPVHHVDKPLPPPPLFAEPPSFSQASPGRLSAGLRAESSRRRQRPENIRSLPAPSRSYRPDPSLLYPQMSPYDTGDAHHHLSIPRSVSQPATPNFMLNEHPSYPEHPPIPRSPTHPPAGRRRKVGNHNNSDAAFQDEAEFGLFLEATAGIGPIPTFRRGSTDTTHLPSRQDHVQLGHNAAPEIEFPTPINETPTTITALQHIAQMPRNTSPIPEEHRSQTPPMDLSESGLHIWVQSPDPAATNTNTNTNTNSNTNREDWLHIPDDVPVDDELPDYASSQAQAHAAQREEATRRAQELQRRWREGARKYGI